VNELTEHNRKTARSTSRSRRQIEQFRSFGSPHIGRRGITPDFSFAPSAD
jgi:hypothetical protein